MKITIVSIWLCWLSVAAAGTQGRYAGTWEYQALNAGDTSFKVEQKGDSLTFYRVLYPEFEGQRFKLEHLYQGKLVGDTLTGKMNVREEGMSDFEFLRAFTGQILGQDKMIMDELRLKRKGPPMAEDRTVQPPAEEPKGYSRVVIQRQKPVDQPAQAPAPEPGDKPAPDKQASQAAPLEIPKLIPVARRIESEPARKARELLTAGDSLYERKRYDQAVEKYAAAIALDKTKIELFYKLGLGHAVLGSLAVRRGDQASARDHYRRAIANWSRASRLDPYNWGARENIRRARDKLKTL